MRSGILRSNRIQIRLKRSSHLTLCFPHQWVPHIFTVSGRRYGDFKQSSLKYSVFAFPAIKYMSQSACECVDFTLSAATLISPFPVRPSVRPSSRVTFDNMNTELTQRVFTPYKKSSSILRYSALWHRTVWRMDTNVSYKHTALILRVEPAYSYNAVSNFYCHTSTTKVLLLTGLHCRNATGSSRRANISRHKHIQYKRRNGQNRVYT
jgi:hypothetical protein